MERGIERTPYISQGQDILPWDSEYQDLNRSIVGLDKSNSYSRGSGILIAPRLVLTAAHCGPGQTVQFGPDSRNEEQNIPIVGEIDYPGFDSTNYIDLGIWVLKHPPNVALPYWSVSSDYGSDMSFYGFGIVEPGGTRGILNRAKCDGTATFSFWRRPSYGHRIHSDCTSAESEGGDSGGPIFNSELDLVGINIGSSSSIDSIAMRLMPSYRKWIQRYVDEYKTILRTGDFDGDGGADFLYWNPNAKGNWVDLSKGSTPDGVADGQTTNWCAQELFVGKFDSDRREDLLCFNDPGSKLYIDYANSSGTFDGTDEMIVTSWCNGELLIGDFNGDGLSDLHCREPDGWRKVDLNNGLSSRFTGSDWSAQNHWCGQELFVGDFNADEIDDLLCWNLGKKMYIKYGNASGSFSGSHVSHSTAWCGTSTSGVTRIVDDVNGDGRDDLVCWDQGSDSIHVDYAGARSYAGTITFPFDGTNWSDTTFGWCAEAASLADVNGDDKADLVCYDDRTGKVWVDYYSKKAEYNGLSDLRTPNITSGNWPY